MKKIQEIKNRLDSRPLEWKSYIEGRDHVSGDSFIMVGTNDSRADDIYVQGATEAEQDFIAHCPEDIRFLLSEIERLSR